MRNRFVLATVAIAALAASVYGARETALHHSDTGFTGRRITMTSASCPRVSGEITIDGRLDEAAWRSAGQVEPRLGVDANNNLQPNIVTDPTVVRLMHDGKNLYVGVTCTETAPEQMRILTGALAHQTWVQDSVELYFDPKRDKKTYYQLMIAAGTGRMSQKGDYSKKQWKGLPDIKWEWKTRIDKAAKAWYVEVKIPLDQIELKGRKGDTFGFNIERKDFAAATGGAPPRSFWTEPKFAPGMPPHANPAYYGVVLFGAGVMVDAVGISRTGLYGTGEVVVECGNYGTEAMAVKTEAKLIVLKKKGTETVEEVLSNPRSTIMLKAGAREKAALALKIPAEGKYRLDVKVTDAKDDASIFSDSYDLTASYDMDYCNALVKERKADELISLLVNRKHPKLETFLIDSLGTMKDAKVVSVLLEELNAPRSDRIDPISSDPNRRKYGSKERGGKHWYESENEGNRAIVLAHILRALDNLGVDVEKDDRMFTAVRPMLDDPMSQVRCLAARALSKMGTKGVKVLADLIEGRDVPRKLSEDKRMLLCLRKFSMSALADRRGDPAVEKYVASAVKSNVSDVQVWALRAMQELGLKGRKAVYSANLTSDAERARMTAAICMGREKEPDPKTIPVLVYIVDNHSPSAIGNEAARLLPRFAAAKVAREVAEMAEGLADAPLERFKTLEMISLHVEPAAMKSVSPNTLLAIVQDKGKSAYHGKALRILGNMKATSVAADLMALYARAAEAGADVKKRGLYIRALGAMGAEKTIPMLADLLKGKEEWIRDEATYALGRIGPKAIPALEQLLGDHTSLSHNVPGSFASACRAAAKKGGHWADVGHARHLPTGLHVSRYAARAIGFMGAAGRKRASAALLRCANGSGTPKGTRFEAARSLSLIGDKASMRKIKPHLAVWMQAYLADMAELGTLMSVMDLQPTRKAGGGWSRPFRAIGQNSRIAGFTKDPLVTWNLSNVLDQGEAANITDGRTDWVGGVFKNQAGLLHYGMLNSYAMFQYLWWGYDDGCVSSNDVVRALGDNGHPAAIPSLKEWLTDSNLFVRYNVAEALGKLGDCSGLDTLLTAFRNRHLIITDDGWCTLADDVDQRKVRDEGHSWRYPVPNADKLSAAEALGYVGSEAAIDRLREILYQKIEIINELKAARKPADIDHLTDIIWIGAALAQLGQEDDATEALDVGMTLWPVINPASYKSMQYKEPAMFAIGKFGRKWTLPVVEEMMLHNWVTWLGEEYEPRAIARDAWERIMGRKGRFDPVRAFDLAWLY